MSPSIGTLSPTEIAHPLGSDGMRSDDAIMCLRDLTALVQNLKKELACQHEAIKELQVENAGLRQRNGEFECEIQGLVAQRKADQIMFAA